MTTLPPPSVKKAPDDSIERKIYDMVDGFANYIEIPNDRYRLSYNLIKFVQGSGDPPEILVHSAKIDIKGITKSELAASINEELGLIVG